MASGAKESDRTRSLNPDFLARAIMETTRDCIIITDASGAITGGNSSVANFTGWAADHLIGQTIDQAILPPNQRDLLRAMTQRCLDAEVNQIFETMIQRRDGNIARVSVEVGRARDDAVQLLVFRMRSVAVAGAEEHNADANYRLLQGCLENAPVGISIFSPDDQVLAVNKYACDFIGMTEEEFLGRRLDPMPYDWPDQQRYETDILPVMREKRQAITMETAMGNRHGEMRNISMTIFPIIGTDGELEAQCIMSVDRTEQVSALRDAESARSQLQSFFDHVPGEMYLKNADRSFVYCSPGLAKLAGVSQADLVGRSEDETVDPRFRERARELHEQVIETKKPFVSEFFQPRSQRYKMVTQFPIINGAGEATYVGGMILDIDERVRAQKELQDAEARLKSFVDNAPIAMSISAADGELLMVNQAAATYYGRSPEELVSSDRSIFLNAWPELRTRVLPAYREVVETRTSRVLETTLRVPGQDDLANVILSAFPIFDAENNVTSLGTVVVDVTEIHAAQRDVARSQEALHQSEKLAALGQLLAGVAHELNNPLAIVLGRASILQEKLHDSEHLASLSKLRDAADRCARIVKTFLAMARQSGPRREMIQINDLIAGALDMTAYGLRGSNISLVQDLDPALPETDADGDQIIQLLINLIVNAQHALQSVDYDRCLTVMTRNAPSEKAILISVADNGPGVPPNEVARIFEPFYTTKDVGEGTGLGLSVCRGLIEAHGGTLTLRETPGGGATFEAMLPTLVSVSIQPANEPMAEGNEAKGQILIVDDEPEIGAILADCLTPLGLTCQIASDGATALELAMQHRFQAIFCDVRMPDMDGIALLAAIEQQIPHLAARLAFVSGDVLHRDVVRIKAASNRPIIEKPFHPQQVRDVAMALIAQSGEKA